MGEIRKPLVIVGAEVWHSLITQGGITTPKRFDNAKSCTLPGISFKTVDAGGAGYMGSMNVPIPGSFESMVFEFSTSGVDASSGDLMMLRTHRFMLPSVQAVHSVSKGTHPQGVKCFVTGEYKGSDGGTLEPSGAIERKYTYEVTRYEEYADGKETLLIDKVKVIYRINGKDMWEDWRKYLEV